MKKTLIIENNSSLKKQKKERKTSPRIQERRDMHNNQVLGRVHLFAQCKKITYKTIKNHYVNQI